MKNFVTNRLLDALNRAARATIDLDPESKNKLAKLQGKVVCLELNAPPIILYLLPSVQGINFCRETGTEPDVTLSGDAIAFARLGAKELGRMDASRELHSGGVIFRGDAELGQVLQKILSELDLDWEELLSHYIGDTPAYKVGNALRGLGGWVRETRQLARENTADYLTEEKRVLITESDMQRFAEAVNCARADVDRLTRRIEKLKACQQSG